MNYPSKLFRKTKANQAKELRVGYLNLPLCSIYYAQK